MASAQIDVLPLRSERDIVAARQAVRQLCLELGFTLVEQTKMVTAASELARNAFTHGGGGEMRCQVLREGPRVGLKLIFEDHGPGIADVGLAMKDGWSSGGGLGMGLSGAKRLVNEFGLESRPGQGTRAEITRWK